MLCYHRPINYSMPYHNSGESFVRTLTPFFGKVSGVEAFLKIYVPTVMIHHLQLSRVRQSISQHTRAYLDPTPAHSIVLTVSPLCAACCQ